MKSFSLTKKSALLSIPLTIIAGLIGVFTWKLLTGQNADIDHATRVRELAAESRYRVAEISDAMKGFLLNPSDTSEYSRKKANDQKLLTSFEEMKTLTQNDELLGQIEETQRFEIKTLDPAEERVISLAKQGKGPEAHAEFTQSYLPARAKYEKLSEKLTQLAAEEFHLRQEAMTTALQRAAKLIIFVFALGLFGASIAVILMIKILSKKVSVFTVKLRESGIHLTSNIKQLAKASQALFAGSSQSASSLEETVASVEELSSMVAMNEDNARAAAGLSLKSSQAAEVGEKEISELITQMNDISQSSKQIEEIINVIDDIAFQTNLLALNAAVEAARAGEQGKGFSVVAEAVRNLSQRSAAAAKDIATLIKESVSKIEKGAATADRSGKVLSEILQSVKKVADLNQEIADASTHQSVGIKQIGKAVSELDQVTQRNAAASEEAAATTEQMLAHAASLQSFSDEIAGLIDGTTGKPADPTQAETTTEATTV